MVVEPGTEILLVGWWVDGNLEVAGGGLTLFFGSLLATFHLVAPLLLLLEFLLSLLEFV